jgi:hypothetical protein
MHPYIMSILNQYHKHQKIIEDIEKAKTKAAYEMHTQGKTSVVIPDYNPKRVEPYLNWMIYSTALLERSYLEYEKRRTMDRAMLQVSHAVVVVCPRSHVTSRSKLFWINTPPS